MPKMDKFADANLDEIQEQMQKLGLTQQSKSLGKAQSHAKSLAGAYDVNNGKYVSGI
jgi:ribosome assembly protein YihI (activator of Der GTPase)